MALICSISRPLRDELVEAVVLERCVGQVGVARCGGEDAGQDGAQRAADGVDAEGVERVVVAEHLLERGAEEERDDAGEHADDHRAVGGHEAAGRRDDDEAGHGAGAEAEDGGLAVEDLFQQRPDEAGDGGGERGGHEGVGGDAVGGDSASRR